MGFTPVPGYVQDYLRTRRIYRMVRIILILVILVLVVPIAIGEVSGTPPETVLALVSSTLVFQAAAAMIGLGLGLPPYLVMILMTSVAVASMIAVFEAIQILGNQSPRLNAWTGKIRERSKNFPFLQRYGALMLIPTIWVPGIGLYGTPVVARIFGWDHSIAVSILYMLAGWLVATAVVLVASIGIFELL